MSLKNETSIHLSALKVASEGMLLFPRSERFIEWVASYLVTGLKASHVSIALYDPVRDSFPLLSPENFQGP